MIKKEHLVEAYSTLPHQYIADASDLGFKPGEWPEAIEVEHLGKFIKTASFSSGPEKELQYFLYRQVYLGPWYSDENKSIKVFND